MIFFYFAVYFIDYGPNYTYDANGNKATETLGNGVVSTYTYNKANKIKNLENKSGDITISSYKYSYFLDGSDACKVRSENGIIETTEYEYDSLKRLVKESVTTGNSKDTYTYEYDDYGNRSKMTADGSENYVTEYNYNNAQGNYTALLQKEIKTVQDENNTLNNNSNIKQTVYTYDANGNQITKTADGKTEINTYDGLNQLIGFTDGTTTASYTYGISGLRDSKKVNGVTTTHIWIGSQIVVDYTTHYTSTVYIRGTSLAAAFDWNDAGKGDYRFYTQNAHGDVVSLTDSTGAVVKSYTYDAFGVEKNINDSDANPFRYCGEYFDAETGTIYLRARYYNPNIGRFISRDSYAGKNEDPLSLNRYTYCHNNPICFIDYNGHWILSAAIGAVCGAVSSIMDVMNDDSLSLGQKIGVVSINTVGGAVGAMCGPLVGAGASALTSYFAEKVKGKNDKDALITAGKSGLIALGGAVTSKAVSKVISKKATSSLFNKSTEKVEKTMKKILDNEGFRMFDGNNRMGSFNAEYLTLKGVAKNMKLPNIKGLPMKGKTVYNVIEKRILGDNVESMLTSGFSTLIGHVA